MNTPDVSPLAVNREKTVRAAGGWLWLLVTMVLFALVVWAFIAGVIRADQREAGAARLLLSGAVLLVMAVVACGGFFALQPNEAAVLILFGAYQGTVRDSGFFWTNPFNKKVKISLRARNLNGEKLKVNDKRGNPVEIAAVVVWRVHDTAQACFDVDNYEHYVAVQSESALRHLASGYAYDEGEPDEVTLRGGSDAVSAALREQLHQRLEKAGVRVEEARLTHLAYAPEIAQAMLRRQQAEAIIAARQKIVHGAVSMVDMALKELGREARRAPRRGAQGRHGQQPARGALRRSRSPSRRQHRHAL